MDANIRPAKLHAFLDAVRAGFEAASTDEKTKACLRRVFDALKTPAPSSTATQGRVPTSALLDVALEPARSAGGSLARLADRIHSLDPLLSWRRRSGTGLNASDNYAEGHANAIIVGPGGLEDRKDAWVGLSLLAPGVRYPDHTHPPEEIYLVLTDGRFQHGESGWFAPGIGGTLYNEPGILHAMESSVDRPLLAIWCLFEDQSA